MARLPCPPALSRALLNSRPAHAENRGPALAPRLLFRAAVRTLVFVVPLLFALNAHAGVGELGLPDCDACGYVIVGGLGGAVVIASHAFFFKELATAGPNRTFASVLMLGEHGVSVIVSAALLADGLRHGRDAAYVSGLAALLAVNVGMLGLASWTLHESLTVTPAGPGAVVTARF